MPSYKFIGDNEGGGVTFGGKRFDKGQPVDVDDPALQAKLDNNAEFERIGDPGDLQAPLWNPPGPTGIGTGPGSGPYQTTNEVIDQNPNPDAGQPTEEELEAQRAAAEAGPEEPPDEPDGTPKRKRGKSEPPTEGA